MLTQFNVVELNADNEICQLKYSAHIQFCTITVLMQIDCLNYIQFNREVH